MWYFLITMASKVMDLPKGKEGVVRTLSLMWDMIQVAKQNPELQKKVRKILLDLPERDRMAEAKRLLDFVRDKIRYVNDPIDMEMLTEPTTILNETLSGDCDDKSILLGSMLESVGIPIKLIVVQTPNKKNYSHVYLNANIDGQWYPIDPIYRNAYVGWEVPTFVKKAEYTKRRQKKGNMEGIGESTIEKVQRLLEKAGVGLYRGSQIIPEIPGLIKKTQSAYTTKSIFETWIKNPLTFFLMGLVGFFAVREILLSKRSRR